MKTIEEVKKEIAEIEAKYTYSGYTNKEHEFAERELNKAAKRRKLLTDCLYYLESNPRKDYIEQMKQTTEGICCE